MFNRAKPDVGDTTRLTPWLCLRAACPILSHVLGFTNKNSCFSLTNFNIGVLDGGADDFETPDEVYEAIGGILHDVSAEKDEDEIKLASTQLQVLQ